MKFVVVTTLAALAGDASANVLMGAGPKLAHRLNFAKVISASPRSRFNAEGHSGSLDLCAEDAPFSGPGHTSHDHDECMASTCDMWEAHEEELHAAEEGLETCDYEAEQTMSSYTTSIDFGSCDATSAYESVCSAIEGKVLAADMVITCMLADDEDHDSHDHASHDHDSHDHASHDHAETPPELEEEHTSQDMSHYQVIFDFKGVPGCFGDACDLDSPHQADLAEFEQIVAHELMEELEAYFEEETGEEVPIHCEGERAGEDHDSHDHASHDHASHDHASHDHAETPPERLRGFVKSLNK